MEKAEAQARTTNPDDESDVPHEVLEFLSLLDAAVHSGDTESTHKLYELRFPQLTMQFFSNRTRTYGVQQPFHPWPSLKFIAKKKAVFSSTAMELLYEGMYYRHMYTDRVVSAFTRGKSWENYIKVFDLMMDPPDRIDLPNGWLWDIMDEYMYQLHIHHTKRLRFDAALPRELHPWSITEARQALDNLITQSRILETLREVESGDRPASSVLTSGQNHITRTVGFFALICRSRLDVALGDYKGALTAIEPLAVPTFGKQITMTAAPAHVALFYNLGFSYLMLRRYTDAAETLKQALRVKTVNRQYVDSLQAQVVSLLMISAALGCLPFHDFTSFLSKQARQTQEDDMQLFLQGDLDRFREVFMKSSPKFVSLVDPMASTTYTEYTGQEGKELQTRVFMRGVQQQSDVMRLRGYLRVYTATDADKIAVLLKVPKGTFAPLICAKQRSREIVHDGVSKKLLAGELKSTPTIDFSVDGKSVLVQRRQETVPCLMRFMQRLQALANHAEEEKAKIQQSKGKPKVP